MRANIILLLLCVSFAYDACKMMSKRHKTELMPKTAYLLGVVDFPTHNA